MSGDSSVDSVKRSLESWREVVLVTDNVLAWKQDWHPAVTAGTLTTVFTMLWYYDPSCLTMFCLLGMFASLADFLGPKILPLVFGEGAWDGAKEKQLERVSKDLVYVHSLLRTCFGCYSGMRLTSPLVHFAVTVLSLLAISWVGSLFSGFFLAFCLSMAVLMLPGLHSRGLLDKYCSGLTNRVKELTKGKKLE